MADVINEAQRNKRTDAHDVVERRKQRLDKLINTLSKCTNEGVIESAGQVRALLLQRGELLKNKPKGCRQLIYRLTLKIDHALSLYGEDIVYPQEIIDRVNAIKQERVDKVEKKLIVRAEKERKEWEAQKKLEHSEKKDTRSPAERLLSRLYILAKARGTHYEIRQRALQMRQAERLRKARERKARKAEAKNRAKLKLSKPIPKKEPARRKPLQLPPLCSPTKTRPNIAPVPNPPIIRRLSVVSILEAHATVHGSVPYPPNATTGCTLSSHSPKRSIYGALRKRHPLR